MSAALITLFVVSALGALAMAIYGFRVLVGRWEQPRYREVSRVAPLPPLQMLPPPPVQQVVPAPHWVATPPAPPAPPAPRTPPPTPPVLGRMTAAGTPAPVLIAPPPAPAFVPVPARPLPPGLHDAPRLARGSIPPDVSPDLYELEPDDDDDIEFASEDPTSRDPIVQRGARFSVIRSTRR